MNKFITIIICGLAIATYADDYRDFTDSQGRTIKAKIVKIDRGAKKVTLERKNKKKATVSITMFSEADQEYINTWSPFKKTESPWRMAKA